jgi:dUTPase
MNYWKKLHPLASLERRSAGAQGVDLVACIDEPVTIMPEARTLIPWVWRLPRPPARC